MRTKIFKILFWLLLWFVTGAVVVGAVVRSKTFQHWVTQKVAQYFSAELKTTVSIGGFDINNLTYLSIDSVFIGDRHNDTAFYVGKLTVDLDRLFWDFKGAEKRISLKNAKIENALINFRQYTDTGDWNYEFVFDYFNPPKDSTDTTVGRPFVLKISNLAITNTAFAFKSPTLDSIEKNKFNPSDFRFIATANLNKFSLVDDSLAFNTKNLTVSEKNGFTVNKIQTNARIHSKGLEFFDLSLATDKSILKEELRMTYNSWDDMEEFLTTVEFDARITDSKVSMEDIAFWAPGMQNLKQMVKVSGLVKGTIDNLKAKNININSGAESFFAGNFNIRGLPDFETSFIDVKLEKSHTTVQDIQAITGIENLPLGIVKMGEIDFTGSFTGFPKSFVAYGNFNTNLGQLTSDIKLDFTEGEGNATYSGYLKTQGFNLGEFVSEPALLGNIALDAKIKGKGLTLATIDAEVIGKINTVSFNNYNYKNIEIDGNYAGKLFEGFARIRDENLDLDFDGGIDFTGELPKMDFVSTIRKANLYQIKMDTLSSSVSGKMYINFVGDKLDNLDGVLSIANVQYRRNAKLLEIDTAQLKATYTTTQRSLHLSSPIVDADISGQYNFSQLSNAMYNYAAHLLPKIVKIDSVQKAEENFRFSINIKRPYVITNFLLENLRVDPFKVEGSINTAKNEVELNMATEQLLYDDITLRQIAIKTIPVAKGIQKLEIKCGKYFQGDSLYLENALATLTFDSSNVLFDILVPQTIANISARLQGALMLSDSLYRLVFQNSSIKAEKRSWSINDKSYISYNPIKNKYFFQNFQVSSQNEALAINGVVSKNINDTLRIDFDNFNIADVNYFTRPPAGQELGGLLNGNVVLYNLFDVPFFTSDLRADSLSFGPDKLGNLFLQAKNNRESKLIRINGNFTEGLLEGSKVSGDINFDKQAKQNLNVSFNLNNATTRFFEPFLVGVVSGLTGSFSTTINIIGTFAKPNITGHANFSKPSFKIDYLQTTYATDTAIIELSNDIIKIIPLLLKDEKGTMANASGYISHNSFSNFKIDFKVQNMRKFLALNTKESDNSLYYGTAYMTGNFSITGAFDDLFMEVKGRSDKGTTFNLKLADESNVSQYDFITFVNYNNEPDTKEPIDLSGIRLNLDLEVTPDAEIKIIFDSQLGDIIQGTGYANLRMEINTLGDFKMFGNFEIEKGQYLFTALDFINKNFIIRKGGTITWTGDPLNAQIDIAAAYPSRTSTQPLVLGLVAESELANYKTPIPVEAVMKLKGPLLKPEIKFGINIPDLTLLRGGDANTSVLLNALRRIERDQEEVSRQVFSLLSLGTFATPIDNGFVASGADGGTASNPGIDAASTTVGNLLSNQISNWLSKYDPKWDIGIQVGQGGTVARTEVILSASRRWLNDRLQFDISADNTSQGNINVNYKITPNGDNQVRVFGRNTNNPIYNQNILSFGGGFYFRKEFEDISELKRLIIGGKLKKTTPAITPSDSIPETITN